MKSLAQATVQPRKTLRIYVSVYEGRIKNKDSFRRQ